MVLTVFTILLSVPVLSWGQGLSFSDSPDWKPASPEQTLQLQKFAAQSGGEFVDAAGYVHGGRAMVMAVKMQGVVNQYAARNYVAGLAHGVTNSGQRLQSQETTAVGPLHGSLLTFEGSTNDKAFSTLAYVLFDEHHAYVFSIYGPAGTTKDSPLVTSYLSRIKFDPNLVPADLNNRAFEAGQQAGKWLFRGLVVGVLLVIAVKLFKGSAKRPQDLQPPPLNP